jgi:hypothetical protein
MSKTKKSAQKFGFYSLWSSLTLADHSNISALSCVCIQVFQLLDPNLEPPSSLKTKKIELNCAKLCSRVRTNSVPLGNTLFWSGRRGSNWPKIRPDVRPKNREILEQTYIGIIRGPSSVASAHSNSLPEQHLSLSIRQRGHPNPHIFRASTAIGHLHIIVQQDMCKHRFQLVDCKESARATIDVIVSPH